MVLLLIKTQLQERLGLVQWVFSFSLAVKAICGILSGTCPGKASEEELLWWGVAEGYGEVSRSSAGPSNYSLQGQCGSQPMRWSPAPRGTTVEGCVCVRPVQEEVDLLGSPVWCVGVWLLKDSDHIMPRHRYVEYRNQQAYEFGIFPQYMHVKVFWSKHACAFFTILNFFFGNWEYFDF